MLIAYRYLLSEYLRIFIFCVVSFIAVLITTRLDEIAHFAALGAQSFLVINFALYQIPYILPIAIPISCLIASVVMMQRLSNSQEITVLRASGLSLGSILAPLLVASAFLSLANFYIVSELATESHLASRNLERQLRTINPLLLLQNKHLNTLQGIYVNSFEHSKAGENANDLVVAFWNQKHRNINLLMTKQLSLNGNDLVAKHMTILGGKGTKQENTFDDIYLENIGEAITPADHFTQFIKQKVWRIHTDYLTMPLLLVHIKEAKGGLKRAKKEHQPKEVIAGYNKQLSKGYSDIARRLSISLAAFTFTLMGASFVINVSRSRSMHGFYLLLGLATLYIVCFFMAKGFDHKYQIATALYLIPHLIILGVSTRALLHVSKGIE